MKPSTSLPVANVKESVSQEEWQTRVDLAALYRLFSNYGWDDLVFTHITARVPGSDNHFLINPYGLLFDEVCASNLVKVDIEGNKVMDGPYDINPAGYVVHSSVHEVRHDAGCVIHLHTKAGIAVSAQKQGLLPISQQATLALASIAYHDYEGIAVDEDEKLTLQRDIGDKRHLILRNHGTLCTGETIADAFMAMYNLETACQIQVAAQGNGAELISVNEEIINDTGRTIQLVTKGQMGGLAWPALIRRLDRTDPSYKE